MTPVFCCGFECGVSGSHWTITGTGSFSTTTVRSGARAIRLNPTAASADATGLTGVGSAMLIVRFYVRFATLPSTTTCIFDNSTGWGVYYKSSDSSIYAGSGTGALGASGVSVTTGQWYRVDARIDNTNGATAVLIDVRVDGAACAQHSVVGDNANRQTLRLGNPLTSATMDMFVDDFVATNTSGDFPIGAGFVNHFIPTSDGTHNVAGANDFEFSATGTDITNATTTAFTLIDDVPLKSGSVTEYINLIAPPNATDYVEVVFGPASGISTPTYAPRAVEAIIAKAKGTGTGANNLRVALNDNGTTNDIFNGDTTTASPTASYARKHYATPPTGGAWTISGAGNFNNLRMRCFTSDAAPDPWWASAMIEAEFDANPPPAPTVKAFSLLGVG